MNRKINQPTLSIIIPTYNEAARIIATVDDTAAYLDTLNIEYEIIVSDAQSPDGTAKKVKSLLKKVPQLRLVDAGPRQGKGMNVKRGLESATGKYRIFADADLATPLHHIPTMLDYLKAGSDLVIAERDLRKIHSGFREMVSIAGNSLVQFLVMPGITDSQCGFKGFSERASRLCTELQTVNGWGFDVEYLLIARRNHMSLASFTIDDWYDPKAKEEGLVGDNTFTTTLKTFRDILKIKIKDLKGIYNENNT